MRAVLLRPEANVGEIIDVDGKLETLQGHVGGYIEHVQLVRTATGGVGMYVNDEGLIRGLPVNALATRLYWGTRKGGIPDVLPHAVHGPAVVLAGPDAEGDDRPVTVEEIWALRNLGVEVHGTL